MFFLTVTENSLQVGFGKDGAFADIDLWNPTNFKGGFDKHKKERDYNKTHNTVTPHFYLARALSIILLFSFFGVSFSFGQNQKSKGAKILWAPPDKSFTIEVPVKLKEQKKTFADVRTFAALKANSAFIVYIHKFNENEKKQTLKDKFGGAEFLIGGDNDNSFVETYLKIDNLSAKSIVYAKQNKKGLMIDTGDKLIVLALVVEKREDLESEVAKRFFTSFNLLK